MDSNKLFMFRLFFTALAAVAFSEIYCEQPTRIAEYKIEPLFLKRQSKYDLHRTLSNDDLRQKLNHLFTAFIWAPSSYNNQPGRLIYALYGTKEWDCFLDLLVPFNKEWASNAGALIVVISRKNFEHGEKPCKTHTLDTGLALENLLLQATSLELIAHPIEGFDYKKAQKELKIPSSYEVEAMIVVGEQAPAKFSKKEFAERDRKPSKRKSVAEFAFEGAFPK